MRGRTVLRRLLASLWGLAVSLGVLPAAGTAPPGQAAARPYEAPLLGAEARLPPVPPEYLTDEVAGIRFVYHPSARDRTRALIEVAAGVRSELVAQLGSALLESLQVRVAVGSADFGRIVPPRSPQGSGVLAFSEQSTLVIGLHTNGSASSGDTLAAFRRGMALLALDEVTDAQALPRWFRIGYALQFSGEGGLARARALWWASMQQRLIPLVDLDWYLLDRASYRSVAGAEAADFVRFLLADDRADGLPRLCEEIRAGHGFAPALRTAYQSDLPGLESLWREQVARHRAFLPILLGSTGLWVLLALGLAVRRRWRRRARKPVADRERAASVSVRKLASRAAGGKRQREARDLRVEPRAPGVPRVSHNGRWHTLH